MRFEQLRVDGLRCLDGVCVTPGPGLNIFIGPNGAGKTSLLEAAYLLSYGRSFRSGARDALIRRGSTAMHVYGEIRDAAGQRRRVGLGREAGGWQMRVDGDAVQRLGDLLHLCAVACFEPGSHALIAGAAEERRRFLDWGVFHVEHGFLEIWQRYRRALKQRNSLLREPDLPDAAAFEPWEQEMGATAARLDALRRAYLLTFEPRVREVCRRLLPELGAASVHYRCGWDDGTGLADVLAARRDRDRARGHTTAGVQRANWRLAFAEAPQREFLSRGQEKLSALACVLAQSQVYADQHGEWPIICLDDLASELDAAHQAAVVAQVRAAGAQILVTGTDVLPALAAPDTAMFHVEHGRVTPM